MDYFISVYDAIILILIFSTYMGFHLYAALKNTKKKSQQIITPKNLTYIKEILFIILGFGILIGGSHITVMAATHLSQKFAISNRLIGLLIVSVGTSLPELFTSVIAIIKNQKSMAVGNIIGSNIFNTFAIIGTSALIHPINLDFKISTLDLPMLLIVNIFLLFIIFGYQKKIIQKFLPYVFFSGYIAYIFYIL